MPPLRSPPTCTMQRPAVMIGEQEGEKRGKEPSKPFLRHNIFPLAASRQERVPCTPRVMTLPSATAGELRGPVNCRAGPVTPLGSSYLSCQSSFPPAASRQRSISLPSCREKTYSLSPTRAGVATPSPTVTFHFLVNSLGQLFGALKPVALASRFGPRHWGQSWALTPPALSSSTQPIITPVVAFAFLMVAPVWSLPSRPRGRMFLLDGTPEMVRSDDLRC